MNMLIAQKANIKMPVNRAFGKGQASNQGRRVAGLLLSTSLLSCHVSGSCTPGVTARHTCPGQTADMWETRCSRSS